MSLGAIISYIIMNWVNRSHKCISLYILNEAYLEVEKQVSMVVISMCE